MEAEVVGAGVAATVAVGVDAGVVGEGVLEVQVP